MTREEFNKKYPFLLVNTEEDIKSLLVFLMSAFLQSLIGKPAKEQDDKLKTFFEDMVTVIK